MNADRLAELTNGAIACPPAQTWREYSRGGLPAERTDELFEHLRQCPDCRRLVSTINRDDDSVVGTLSELSYAYGREAPLQELTRTLSRSPGELTHWLEAEDRSVFDERPLEGVPREIDAYRILEPLGKGAVGRVFKARHKRLEKFVAVKLLAPRRGVTPDLVERFEREMRAVGRIDHPNVIGASDAGEADGFYFLVMDCLDGLDASRLVAGLDELSVADACEIVRQAALGIQAAHDHDLIHRDVKPSNLLVTDQGVVKLLDLGLVRPGRSSDAMGGGKAVGTPQYMAPEQWCGERVDERTDVYGLGCTLFKLLCGVAPYELREGGPPKMVGSTNDSSSLPSVGDFRRDVPEEVAQIIAGALANRPQDRIASAKELADRLEMPSRGADLPALVNRARISALSETLHGAQDVTLPEPVSVTDTQRISWSRVGVTALTLFVLAGAIFGVAYAWGPSEILAWRTVVPPDTEDYFAYGPVDPKIQVFPPSEEPGITLRGDGMTLFDVGRTEDDSYAIRTTASAKGNVVVGVFFAASAMTETGFDYLLVELRRLTPTQGFDVQLYHVDYKRSDGTLYLPIRDAICRGRVGPTQMSDEHEIVVRIFPLHLGVYVDGKRVIHVPRSTVVGYQRWPEAGLHGAYGVMTDSGRATFSHMQYLQQSGGIKWH